MKKACLLFSMSLSLCLAAFSQAQSYDDGAGYGPNTGGFSNEAPYGAVHNDGAYALNPQEGDNGAPVDGGAIGYSGGAPVGYEERSPNAGCPPERFVGNCYCLYCRYEPCYYNKWHCNYVPKYTYKKCCRYVPQYYQKQCCRYVPQYYYETCCRQCPQYYYTCNCQYVPKYTCERCCRYVPKYYYKRTCCPQQPCCPPQQPCCPPPACQ